MLGCLAKIVFVLTVVVATSLSPFVPTALAATDDDVYDAFDTFEQFEQMDAAEFDDLIEQAKGCITDWDFACAKESLKKAKRYITKKADNATIASLKKFMEFEKILARSSKCARDWNFDCAVEKLKDAKQFAEANLNNLYVGVSTLESRLEAVADYIEEQYALWEKAAKRNPDIVLVDAFETSRGMVFRAEVWAAGKKVMSTHVLIERYNPFIGGYEIALFEDVEAKDHPVASAILSSVPRLLCSLYIYGPGYYTNELRCAGTTTLGRTEGDRMLNYPLERLVKEVVEYYYFSSLK